MEHLPVAGLIQDARGNLYGTTVVEVGIEAAGGTVFKLDSSGKETVLYSFCSVYELHRRSGSHGWFDP